MNQTIEDLEKVSKWKGIAYILRSWLTISLAIVLALHFKWFYCLAVFIIANRILALGFLIHEGLHVLIFPNQKINDTLTRYLCAYPIFVSFSRFRNIHVLHHKFLSTELDLDREMYTYFPMPLKTFLYRFVTGQIFSGVFLYFSEIDLLLNLRTFFNRLKKSNQKFLLQMDPSDLKSYLLFHGVVFSIFFLNHWQVEYFKFWIMPYLLLQPYVLVYNCLQHAKVYSNEVQEKKSRTITGPLWLMPAVLPINVNYHSEHHYNQKIPQYNLKKFSDKLRHEKPDLFLYEGYFEALFHIFKKETQ